MSDTLRSTQREPIQFLFKVWYALNAIQRVKVEP